MNMRRKTLRLLALARLIIALFMMTVHDARAEWDSQPGPADSARWDSLGGELTSSPNCVSWGPKRVDCFAVGAAPNYEMLHVGFDGSKWAPWDPLGGNLTYEPFCIAPSPNRLNCFARMSDGMVWHKWWDGSSWKPSPSTWDPLGGETIENPVAVARGSKLDVFVRRFDGAMWHKTFNGTTWDAWESLGGNLWSRPSCVSWGPDRIDCIAPLLGGITGGLLSHKWWDGKSWYPSRKGWNPLNGETRYAPVVVSWGSERLDVFVRGTDNAMWHTWRDPNTPNWGSWESLGGVLTSSPDCVSWSADRLDCFVRGTDDTVFHKFWDGNHWGPSRLGWEPISGKHKLSGKSGSITVPAVKISDAPASVAWASDRLDIFVRRTDDRMWHMWWSPIDSSVPSCIPQVVVGGVNPQPDPHPWVLQSSLMVQQINQALDPTQTVFDIPMRVPTDGFKIKIETAVTPSIPSGTAEVVLINDGGWDKHVTTCSPGGSPQSRTVADSKSAMMTISRTASTTVYLSKDVCTFWIIGCLSVTTDHIAVFGQDDFWNLVDGRRITIRW